LLGLLLRDFEDLGGLFDGEILHRGQQQGLAAERGDAREAQLRRLFRRAFGQGGGGALVHLVPHLAQRAVERDSAPLQAGAQFGIGQCRFKQCDHQRVACRLIAA
jgi:hypothetical protein